MIVTHTHTHLCDHKTDLVCISHLHGNPVCHLTLPETCNDLYCSALFQGHILYHLAVSLPENERAHMKRKYQQINAPQKGPMGQLQTCAVDYFPCDSGEYSTTGSTEAATSGKN